MSEKCIPEASCVGKANLCNSFEETKIDNDYKNGRTIMNLSARKACACKKDILVVSDRG